MTTEYILTDSLPKDKTGAKIIAPIDDSTSQLDFGVLRGIASESLGATSKNLVFLGVGSHTIGSAIGTKVGELALGVYTNAPSSVGDDNAQAMRVDKQGALFTRGAQTSYSQSGASVETHIAGSGLLHGYSIRFNDVNAGDRVDLEDNNTFVMSIVADSASQHKTQMFPVGILFSTSLVHSLTVSGAGAASVTLFYSQ